MVETPLQYQDMHAVIINSSKRFGLKDFIISVDQGKSISSKEFDECSNKVANFLSERGITKSDFISLVGKNSIETLIIFFGVLRYGAILNLINSEESKQNILRIIQRVKPKILIYDHEIDLDFIIHRVIKLPFADFDVVEKKKSSFFLLSRATIRNLELHKVIRMISPKSFLLQVRQKSQKA